MAKILVLGGRGTLGTALIPRLIAAGHTVRSASRTLPANGDPRVEWHKADLATGEGLLEATQGMDVVMHLASAGLGDSKATDVDGTARLLEASRSAGIQHLIYISIVGIDKIDFDYYKHKLEAERLIEASGVPYSILRAPQFPSLIDFLLSKLTAFPIAFVDTRWTVQLMDEGEVSDHLVDLVAAGSSGRVPDIGGPEIRKMGDLTRAWLAARGMKRLIIPMPWPGGLGAGLRKGLTTVPHNPQGHITWEQWLASRYGTSRTQNQQPIREEKSA